MFKQLVTSVDWFESNSTEAQIEEENTKSDENASRENLFTELVNQNPGKVLPPLEYNVFFLKKR